jgi:hypothetical protein
MAAGPVKPRDPDPHPDIKMVDARSDQVYSADNFMAGNDGKLGIRQFAVNHMKVCPANAAGRYQDPDLASRRQRIGALD